MSFRRSLNQNAIAGPARAIGASVLTPKEDWFAAFPAGVRSTLTATDDTVYFVPFAIDRPCTIQTMQVEVTTGAGATTARFAIYGVDDSLEPGDLIGESATVATTGTGLVSATLADELPVGIYFAAVKIDGAAVALRSVNVDSAMVCYGDAAADLDGAAAAGEGIFLQASVGTAFPSNATVGAARGVAAPLIVVEFQSVEA
jgi:hypothetical protein